MLPKENAVLNYRLIGFSFPGKEDIIDYKIEIARGYFTGEDSFKKNIIVSQSAAKNKIIAEVPAFGSQYTWRIIYPAGTPVETPAGRLFHFSTAMIPAVDTNNMRLRICKPAEKYGDAFVFLDGNGVLYDVSGRPIWFLPQIEGKKPEPIDLKLSAKGTITFISKPHAYEINYNGDILWENPVTGNVTGLSKEQFHHQLTRLANGHYMVLGTEHLKVLRKQPLMSGKYPFFSINDSSKTGQIDTTYFEAPFGTIEEYDEKGNLVWSWKSSSYILSSDIYDYYRMLPGPFPDYDIHENSFYFDEKNKVVYLGFRTISRILKIKYPEGEILSTYGEIYKPGGLPKGNEFFYGQHSCNHSDNGYLYVFNNNMRDSNCLPKITILKERSPGKERLKKIWEYDFPAKDLDEKIKPGFSFNAGGNVAELPDNSMFVSMGVPDSKLFIVSREKKVLWSALPEKWDEKKGKWTLMPQYRASIIANRKDLERLIWNEEIKNE